MRPRLLERRLNRFLTEPVSVRGAMAVIVWGMGLSVVVGGLVVWLFDHADFPNLGVGWWWSLQTVTTVGYGDIVPTTALGRAVGAVIMLESIAFVSVLTAAIASNFVARTRRRTPGEDTVGERLDEIAARLDAIENAIRAIRGPAGNR
jgi:voltage-gated potassium channel